jgi:two-component system chemotaxis response regulator CheY
MKVLVVDDSVTMRRIIRNVLGQVGCGEVAEACNGLEAVTAAADKDIKLILMDWNMPEMSGLQAVGAIRKSGNTTPIVMVTTEAEKRRVIEAIQAGCNDYLIKPFTPDALAAKIAKHVPAPAATAAAQPAA